MRFLANAARHADEWYDHNGRRKPCPGKRRERRDSLREPSREGGGSESARISKENGTIDGCRWRRCRERTGSFTIGRISVDATSRREDISGTRSLCAAPTGPVRERGADSRCARPIASTGEAHPGRVPRTRPLPAPCVTRGHTNSGARARAGLNGASGNLGRFTLCHSWIAAQRTVRQGGRGLLVEVLAAVRASGEIIDLFSSPGTGRAEKELSPGSLLCSPDARSASGRPSRFPRPRNAV